MEVEPSAKYLRILAYHSGIAYPPVGHGKDGKEEEIWKRVFKLDIKGYNRADDKWARISEGDIDYADVRKALKEINFYGWCAAEVGGGDATELKRIASEMDSVFGLA